MIEALTPSEYYNKGLSDRKPYEDRAELFAKVTIPALFRETGSTGSDALPNTYVQSFGADLVKSLSSKIAMTLFPPSASGFKLSPDMAQLQELTGGNADMASQVNALLSQSTDGINRAIEIQDIRRMIFGLIDQLLIVGGTIMEKVPNKGIKIHNLRTFVVTLDDNGDAIKMCIKETRNTLPKNLLKNMEDDKDEYELYTQCTLDRKTDKWVMLQELDGELMQEVTYNKRKFPFEYQGMMWSIGEKYYRPFVEDYYGSLNSYDVLARVLTEGAIIASKSITFVDERGGRTRKKDVAQCKNGAVIDGSAQDVTSYQHGKNFDFQVPMQEKQELKQELSKAFLSSSSVQRQAERVTAEEIRKMSQELESSLAGVYAVMASKITRRVIEWIMDELKIDLKTISVDIITGLNALGMSNEINKLDGFVSRLAQLNMIAWVEEKELADRYAQGYGVNTVGLMKSPQKVQQERQQAQQEAQKNQLVMSGADSLGKSAGQTVVQNGGQ